MITEWLAMLEATGVATSLRDSVWSYPLVNAGHLLGTALLVGGILPLDLRLLGVWRFLPLLSLWRVLRVTAACGLALAIGCGALLFITRATEYAASPIYWAKMTMVALGIVNALLLHCALNGRRVAALSDYGVVPGRARVAAVISMLAWISALILGRMLGYF